MESTCREKILKEVMRRLIGRDGEEKEVSEWDENYMKEIGRIGGID